jgi:peptidoglycan/LPS O-acetylase OafA/YrhL
VRRIYPALITVLLTTFAVGWVQLFDERFQQLGAHLAGAAVFASNLVLYAESGYFDTASDAKPLLHLWSLGVEEQFYILWPVAVMRGLAALGRRWSRCGCAGSGFCRQYCACAIPDADRYFSGLLHPDGAFLGNCWGAALALAERRTASCPNRSASGSA